MKSGLSSWSPCSGFLLGVVALLSASHLAGNIEQSAAQALSYRWTRMSAMAAPAPASIPTITVAPGEAFQVGVCLSGIPAPLGNLFQFSVIYDDTVINAPEIALRDTALDDNPDANAGATTWGDGLGENWTCNFLDLGQQPIGDGDPETGPGHGLAEHGLLEPNRPLGFGRQRGRGRSGGYLLQRRPGPTGSHYSRASECRIGRRPKCRGFRLQPGGTSMIASEPPSTWRGQRSRRSSGQRLLPLAGKSHGRHSHRHTCRRPRYTRHPGERDPHSRSGRNGRSREEDVRASQDASFVPGREDAGGEAPTGSGPRSSASPAVVVVGVLSLAVYLWRRGRAR